MKNLTRFVPIGFSLFLQLVCFLKLYGQCSPPQSENCDEANVLCSLAELNGYECNNPSTVPSPCSPLCSQGGVGHNTSWWAFVTNGGKITLTLTNGGCTSSQGMQYGIWGDCNCGEEIACRSIPCIPPNSVSAITIDLKPCKTYYLWVDGCSGDICDFTINTSIDTSPVLKPLSFINNEPGKVITVCEGLCNGAFYLNPQPGGCEPAYVWTLDGNEVDGGSNEIKLDFPLIGQYTLCVTAYIGNPKSGSVCSQEGPQCATIKVIKSKELTNQIRWVCPEIVKNGFGSDANCTYYLDHTYKCVFTDSTCCKTIETGHYNVLPVPSTPDVYYITCNNEPYIDALGRGWSPCKDHFEISLPKSTDRFSCDSSIKLTAVNVDYFPSWRISCIAGQVEIAPNIKINKPCSVGETYEFQYRWYKKSNGAVLISSDEILRVDPVDEDYCLEVIVKVDLETESVLCHRMFCESYHESDLAPQCFPLNGDRVICANGFGNYWIDTFISQKVNFFTWTIDGGFIVSNPDSQGVKVKWLIPAGDSGTVCAFYDTDCGKSCEKCIKVGILKNLAGKDFKQKGLIAKLNSTPAQSGNWRQISGPGKTIFQNAKDPKSRIRVDAYGSYCYEWSVSDFNCNLKDTVCIEFYKIKISTPDFPHTILDDRSADSDNGRINSNEIFTPNLISSDGNSYVLTDEWSNGLLLYSWYNNLGNIILMDKLSFESGISRLVIRSPLQEGMYYLHLDLNGVRIMKKICVIN